ncbi:hypothetical protein T4D_15662 [Trichinella pseudospiralis]|uniref:Uncharacterized protein n=1 Tax=Trichinella pseudospiralis TaxID=6337 RepID=A0A0V1FDJ2_TRIPS|nr:hypothetical protein T4D_15662 [Trichinella pseudospiralis]
MKGIVVEDARIFFSISLLPLRNIFKALHTHQKKKLKNKLDHFITIKCFTMRKKREYHVVKLPFCCISEGNAVKQKFDFPFPLLSVSFALSTEASSTSLTIYVYAYMGDLVLLLLCCLLYELNLFNDLLNLI